MKPFSISFATALIRFYLMMAIALVAGFANIPWLAVLCLPLFLSAILGISFKKEATHERSVEKSRGIATMKNSNISAEAA